MLANRHMSVYWELLRWLAILGLALATAVGFTTRMAGGADLSGAAQPIQMPTEPLGAATK